MKMFSIPKIQQTLLKYPTFKDLTVISARYGITLLLFVFLIYIQIWNEISYMKDDIPALLFALLFILLPWTVAFSLKYFFKQKRPYQINSGVKLLIPVKSRYSFPSGHSAFVASLVFWVSLPILIDFYMNPSWHSLPHLVFSIAFLLLGTVVTFSRVFVGAHFFRDIFAGWLIGLFVPYLLIIIVKMM